jgi:hypothetical protein
MKITDDVPVREFSLIGVPIPVPVQPENGFLPGDRHDGFGFLGHVKCPFQRQRSYSAI